MANFIILLLKIVSVIRVNAYRVHAYCDVLFRLSMVSAYTKMTRVLPINRIRRLRQHDGIKIVVAFTLLLVLVHQLSLVLSPNTLRQPVLSFSTPVHVTSLSNNSARRSMKSVNASSQHARRNVQRHWLWFSDHPDAEKHPDFRAATSQSRDL